MLDTDVSSYTIKSPSPSLKNKLTSIDPSLICISAVTRAELLCGLKRLPGGHRIQIAVRHFLKNIRVSSWDSEAADFYADIRHQLVTTGQIIGELDMMIAAHSLSAAAVLVANNMRHYERITALCS